MTRKVTFRDLRTEILMNFELKEPKFGQNSSLNTNFDLKKSKFEQISSLNRKFDEF